MRNENEMYIARYVKTRYKMEVDSLTRIYKRVWGQETGYCVRQTVAFSLRSITGLQIFKEKEKRLNCLNMRINVVFLPLKSFGRNLVI